MAEPEVKICPRCQQHFECNATNVQHCQCATVKLEQHHRDVIAKKYDDCLCANCLMQLCSD